MKVQLTTLFFLWGIFITPIFTQIEPIDITQGPVCGFDLMNHLEDHDHPHLKQNWEEYVEHVLPNLSQRTVVSDTTITIPIVVHIIHDGEPIGVGKNISEDQVLAQIANLNLDFAGMNAEFNNTPNQWANSVGAPNINFCLASLDPDGNPTNGIDRQEFAVTGSDWQNNNINSEIKPAFNWLPSIYFNIYVLEIPGTSPNGGVVGFANRPFQGVVGSTTDGIVVDHDWFGAPGFAASGYRTITHETGHYLGLSHTFNGESCGADDGIDDTPNISEATSGLANFSCANSYPTGPVSCGNEHMYINYMDYINENCYTSFTNGQINVMRSVLEGVSVPGFNYGSRESLVDNAKFVCSLIENDAGIVDVLNPVGSICTQDDITPTVVLRNFGTNSITSVDVHYQINGGTPTTINWTGDLGPGLNEELDLPPFTPDNGVYLFTTYTSLPNGMQDQQIGNDTISFFAAVDVPQTEPLAEDFETSDAFPTTEGLFTINPDNDPFIWRLGIGVSAFGIDSTCVFFDNYNGDQTTNPFGTIDALATPFIDISSLPNLELSFDVAYAEFLNAGGANFNDTLIVLVATECSSTFSTLAYINGGATLATAPATTDFFIPTADQWRTETIDLTPLANETQVAFAFVNFSGWGNALFIDNIQIGVGCELELSAMGVDATCADECTGMAMTTVTGEGNLTYEWSANANGQTTANVNNLCAGTYSVTVTSDLGCSATQMVEIGEPALLMGTTSQTDETAFGANDGTATVSASGGTGNLSFAWSNGQNMATASNLSPGNYTVTVSDENNCTITESVTINPFDCGNFAITASGMDATCFNQNNGSTSTNTTGGTMPFQYEWNNGEQTAALQNLAPGTYTVTVTDTNNCTATDQVTIAEPQELMLMATATGETANGASDGTATAFSTGGTPNYSYSWSNGMMGATIMNLAPNDYSVTVTDSNGCTASTTITVNSFDCGSFGATISSNNISCFNANDGTASVVVTGGQSPFGYAWSNGGDMAMINNLSPGQYSVTVSDASGCETVLTTNITQPSVLAANAVATAETGNNANDGTATAAPTGGTTPYSYLWSNGGTMASISNLAPADYTVTVTDANNCTAIQTVTVDGFDCNLSAMITGMNVSCDAAEDGTASVINITGNTGAISISWSTGSTEATITDLAAGTYGVTVMDAGGCEWTGSIDLIVEDNVPPDVNVQDLMVALSNNGTAILTVEMIDAGSTDNCAIAGSILSQSMFDCSDIGENEVTLTINDTAGNSAQMSATITIEDRIPPVFSTCPDDITVNDCNAVINYDLPTFTDNCGATISLDAGFASGETFPSGETEVVYLATDDSGNSSMCSFTVTVDYDLALTNTVDQPTCPGSSDGAIIFETSGGVAPFFINFEGGGDPVDLSAGTYGVTVTDNNGCSVTDEVEVTDPEILTFEFGPTTPATNGEANGAAIIEVNGGVPPYTYSWVTGGQVISTDQNPTNLPPGDYIVEVIDDNGNGCTLQTDIVTVENIVGTKETSNIQLLKVFPNPTVGKLFVQIGLVRPSDIAFAVIDVTGKEVVHQQEAGQAISNTTFELNLAELSNGVYWLRMLVDEEVISKRVVVLH